MNPELRQTFNTISRNFESANEAAQVNIYDFTSHYIDPCLNGLKAYFADCVSFCFPARDEQLRRRRGHSQGRDDFGFDFYDDWEEDEHSAAQGMGWGNDELDSLLAGRGQPRTQRTMSYGARGRKNDADSDPNLIPKSSYLGFLDRLPFKLGARGLRYKPSAAGLTENPGGLRIRDVVETEPLIPEDEAVEPETERRQKGHARTRSHTGASQSTATSRSARSDLIMSDEEEDAIPLDDEFAAVMLSRRTTSTGNSDEQLGNKSGSGKRPALSRVSTKTMSSKSLHNHKTRRSSSKKSLNPLSSDPQSNQSELEPEPEPEPPTMLDLKREEDELEEQEELEIVMKREAASTLAKASGLSNGPVKPSSLPDTTEIPSITPNETSNEQHTAFQYPSSPTNAPETETEPFPEMSTTRKSSDGDIRPP